MRCTFQPSGDAECSICSKPALKYSSYGGLACTSCRWAELSCSYWTLPQADGCIYRSFFRRSARMDKYKEYRSVSCLSIFVFFRKWIVWQLPSMVLKWKAPQSLLCHRSRQWQLQQCRSLNTTNTVSLFLPLGFSFLVWFKFSLTLFQFIQRASFSKLFLKFRDKVYCH